MVHGMFTDAFRFDTSTMLMASEADRVMNERMPLLHMEPKMDFITPENDYQCPLYKTGARAGVLSTTGKFMQIICLAFVVLKAQVVRVNGKFCFDLIGIQNMFHLLFFVFFLQVIRPTL